MTAVRFFLVLVPLACLAIAEPAGAADPNAVGIVMKVTGETDPALPPREEIPANVKIKLAPGTERPCRMDPSSGFWPTCSRLLFAGYESAADQGLAAAERFDLMVRQMTRRRGRRLDLS